MRRNTNSNTGGSAAAARNRAVIYARASTNRVEQSESTEQQIAECYAYAERHGLTVLQVFEDDGYSGTKDNRPQLQELIQQVKAARGRVPPFDNLLIWKFNRFFRNDKESPYYKFLLHKAGVRVISITQSIGEGDEADLMAGIFEQVDAYYSKQLAADVRRGMRSTAAAGYWTMIAPFGYKTVEVLVGEKTKARLEIDDTAAPTIRLIFELASAGHSVASIAKRLNSDGIPTPRNTRWRYKQIGFIIRNPVYTGALVYGKTVKAHGRRMAADDAQIIRIENNHPALVSREVFDRANALLEDRAHRHPREIGSTFLLSGLLRCACGGAMSGQTTQRGRYHYYKCTDRSEGVECEAVKYIKREVLESQVLDEIASRILAPEMITDLVRLSNAHIDQTGDDGRQEIETEITNLRAAKTRMLRLVETGGLDGDADVGARLKELTNQIQRREQQLYQLAAQAAVQPVYLDEYAIQEYVAGLHHVLRSENKDEAKSALRGFIRRIEVRQPEVTIKFTLPLPPSESGEISPIGSTGHRFIHREQSE